MLSFLTLRVFPTQSWAKLVYFYWNFCQGDLTLSYEMKKFQIKNYQENYVYLQEISLVQHRGKKRNVWWHKSHLNNSCSALMSSVFCPVEGHCWKWRNSCIKKSNIIGETEAKEKLFNRLNYSNDVNCWNSSLSVLENLEIFSLRLISHIKFRFVLTLIQLENIWLWAIRDHNCVNRRFWEQWELFNICLFEVLKLSFLNDVSASKYLKKIKFKYMRGKKVQHTHRRIFF